MKEIILLLILAAVLLPNIMRGPDRVKQKRREVQHNISRYNRKARLRLIGAVITSPVRYTYNYIKNTQLLDSYSWYRALSGNWTDSHACRTIPPREICRLNPGEFKKTYFGG